MQIDEKTKKELVTSFIKCRFNPKEHWAKYLELMKETGLYITGDPTSRFSKPRVMKAKTKKELEKVILRAKAHFGLITINTKRSGRTPGHIKQPTRRLDYFPQGLPFINAAKSRRRR